MDSCSLRNVWVICAVEKLLPVKDQDLTRTKREYAEGVEREIIKATTLRLVPSR